MVRQRVNDPAGQDFVMQAFQAIKENLAYSYKHVMDMYFKAGGANPQV